MKQNKMETNKAVSSEPDKENEKEQSNGGCIQSEQLFRLTKKTAIPTFAPEVDLTWFVLLGFASVVRLFQLSKPNYVVFDEVHFGKFTSYILQGRFFFDTHPPLGKLMLAAGGYITGFDGSFTFDEIGQEIPSSVLQGVLYLRLVPSIFSIITVPLIYEILLELNCIFWFAVFGAVLVCFENTFVVQSRFVLLDAFLLFFIASSLCCYIKFLKEYTRPFSCTWWLYLVGLGVSLTGAISVKYTGFLSVLLILSLIVYELWLLIGDITIPAKSIYNHILARFGCIFLLPLFLYVGQFYILLNVLHKTGPHDGIMSSSFQRTLEGGLESVTKNQAEVISFGSQITLRNTHSKQCWLHSHTDLYPVKYQDGRGSSAQQQVTCYAFKDINNWFIVKHPESESLTVDFPPHPVKNGDTIHLVHGVTGRGLNSHDVGAPLNPNLMEVSGYVDHNVSMDPQFGWRLEIVNPDSTNMWKAIGSHIRLVHINTSAAIRISGETLPDWGFHQYEIGTDRRTIADEAVWNVEEHNQNITKPEGMSDEEAKKILNDHSRKQELHGQTWEMSFLEKFWELQVKMLKLKTDLKDEHDFASKPFHWPLMLRGVAYWIDQTTNKQVFCFGNPLVYWLGTACILMYSVLLCLYLARRKRKILDLSDGEWNMFLITAYLVLGGYVINFIRYIPEESTLFLHHYLPCLLHKTIIIPISLDHLCNVLFRNFTMCQVLVKLGTLVYGIAVISSFNYFSLFTYGNKAMSSSEIQQMKWLSSWEFLAHRET